MFISGTKGLNIQSLAGAISIYSLTDFTIQSKKKAVRYLLFVPMCRKLNFAAHHPESTERRRTIGSLCLTNLIFHSRYDLMLATSQCATSKLVSRRLTGDRTQRSISFACVEATANSSSPRPGATAKPPAQCATNSNMRQQTPSSSTRFAD